MLSSQLDVTPEDLERLRAVQAWRPPRQSDPPPPAAAPPVPSPAAPPRLATQEELDAAYPVSPCVRCGAMPRCPKLYTDSANDARIAAWMCERCGYLFDDAVRQRVEDLRRRREQQSVELARNNEAVAARIGQRPHGGSLGPGRLVAPAPATASISAGPPVFDIR